MATSPSTREQCCAAAAREGRSRLQEQLFAGESICNFPMHLSISRNAPKEGFHAYPFICKPNCQLHLAPHARVK